MGEQESCLDVWELLYKENAQTHSFKYRIRSYRNYSQIPVIYKNNVSNNSSDENEKCAALGVLGLLCWKYMCRDWGMAQRWKLQTPALGRSWTGWLLKPLSISKFFSMTSSGIEGDLKDLVTQCTQRTYYPRIGEQLFSISTVVGPKGNGLWL